MSVTAEAGSVEVLLQGDVDFAKLLDALEKEQKAKQVQVEGTRGNRQSRINAWKKPLDELDTEQLTWLSTTMATFVEEKFNKVAKTEPSKLTVDEREQLMDEYLTIVKLQEALTARIQYTRRMVFNHLNMVNEESGIPEPDNCRGRIDVPELGKKFCREGTGRMPSKLSETKLQELLTEEEWAELVIEIEHKRQVIPAWTEKRFSQDKLVAFLQKNPEKMAAVRESLVQGEKKPAKFIVRDM